MKKLIFALATCTIFASCVKDEDKDPIDVSKTTYLKDGGWQLKKWTWLVNVDDSTSETRDIYEPLSGCEKDNYLIFNTNNTVTRYEGNSKCEISAPDSVAYSYELVDNDGFLRIWSNPEDKDNSIVLAGKAIYPSIDTFFVTYRKPHPSDSTKTSEYVETYVKQK